MANKLYDETSIQNIANAIRLKNGSSDSYTVGQMAQAIQDIPSGGNVILTQFDNYVLNNTDYIRLPQTLLSPNTSYFIDFTTEINEDATGNKYIFGIENNYAYNFIGIRYDSLRYQVGQNGGSTNITNSWTELVGRHTFFYDGIGTVYFDTDAHTYTYNPTNLTGDGINILLGTQGDPPNLTNGWKGKIHRFTIRDVANDTTIADYVPAGYVSSGNVLIAGLLDTVSNNFITAPSGSVSDEEP